jgi:glycosyltransferase involved in cell wall biosynthesis
MRVLLSAFACAPGQGSEEGIGWNWAVELARLGHEVVVLTDSQHQALIEARLAEGDLPPTLDFAFFMPAALDRFRHWWGRTVSQSLSDHLTHLVWQLLVLSHARQRFVGQRFDVVHHITYGGIRHPSLLGRLPWPFVLGPVGGGERAPMALRRGMPWRGWIKDLARDIHTFLIRFDPITRRACADAEVIYVKTEQSRDALPRRYHPKVGVQLEVGIADRDWQAKPPRPEGEPLRLLYAGRFVYWKGMQLGLEGLAAFLKRGGKARLTMLGRGPDEAAWRKAADALGIADAVEWHAWIEHDRMGDLYRAHDALLFPSLHDSSGNAVLEALAHGLPVICLDLGGPAVMVDSSCGRVVSTAERRREACVRGISKAIAELAASPELCRQLSEGAIARAKRYRWPDQVGRLYADIARRLPGAERLQASATSSTMPS